MSRLPIKFTKLHGIGNDFVLVCDVDDRSGFEPDPALIRRMGDRNKGIGFDQLLWLKLPGAGSPAAAGVEMVIFNADASLAEMCGNGIRAAALYLSKHCARFSGQSRIIFQTLAGLIPVTQLSTDAGIEFDVELGHPKVHADSLELSVSATGRFSATFDVRLIELGNPHAVVWVDESHLMGKSLTREFVALWGPVLENHPKLVGFKPNVGFVQVQGKHELLVSVWERGAGATLACGTGATAAAIRAIKEGKVSNPVRVILPGGALMIDWREGDAPHLIGPAQEVYDGVWK